MPILAENCFTCDGPDTKIRKADLRLDLKETALPSNNALIVPSKSGKSELIERVASSVPWKPPLQLAALMER